VPDHTLKRYVLLIPCSLFDNSSKDHGIYRTSLSLSRVFLTWKHDIKHDIRQLSRSGTFYDINHDIKHDIRHLSRDHAPFMISGTLYEIKHPSNGTPHSKKRRAVDLKILDVPTKEETWDLWNAPQVKLLVFLRMSNVWVTERLILFNRWQEIAVSGAVMERHSMKHFMYKFRIGK